jgi:acylphosphatase
VNPTAEDGATAAGSKQEQIRVTLYVHGFVQGVGFRWFTRAKALEFGVVGSATNLSDGRVRVVAQGPAHAVRALTDWLRSESTPGTVTDVVEQSADVRDDLRGFDVR